jgi:hypothetical protein
VKIEDSTEFQMVSEQFPRIGSKLRLFWGYPEFVKLMLELQQDSSERPRAGFPGQVLLALQTLEELHDAQFPHLKRNIPSLWQMLK